MKAKKQIEDMRKFVRDEYFDNIKRNRADLNSYFERVWDVCDWVLEDKREKLGEKKIKEV